MGVNRRMNTIFNQSTEIRIHREPWACDTLTVHLLRWGRGEAGSRSVSVCEQIVFRTINPSNEAEDTLPAVLRLRPEEAQQFMDELWRAGIRPTEGQGSAGALAATERHLQDMRTLVFQGKAP